jgi:hypothetical protein
MIIGCCSECGFFASGTVGHISLVPFFGAYKVVKHRIQTPLLPSASQLHCEAALRSLLDARLT